MNNFVTGCLVSISLHLKSFSRKINTPIQFNCRLYLLNLHISMKNIVKKVKWNRLSFLYLFGYKKSTLKAWNFTILPTLLYKVTRRTGSAATRNQSWWESICRRVQWNLLLEKHYHKENNCKFTNFPGLKITTNFLQKWYATIKRIIVKTLFPQA